MLRSLSSWLSARADREHDSRIPAEKKNFIAMVAGHEQAMRRESAPADLFLADMSAYMRELTAQVAFYTRAYDSIARLTRMAEGIPALEQSLAIDRETKVRAEAEIVALTERIEDLAMQMRMHVRPLTDAMRTLSHLKEGAA